MNRRDFIHKLGLGGLALGLSNVPLELLAGGMDPDFAKISVLHTNDMHSRIDPFPEGSKYAGLGGMAKRAQLIKKIRSEEANVVILDAGDIFQGTPYFNVYGGELEFKLMSEMAYDAATLGNHDFDAGLEGLVKQMPLAKFNFLNANYILDNTPLLGRVQEYQVIERDDVKIGIFGVGIELNGLVPDKLFGEVRYTDPLVAANKTARFLKEEMGCSLIICLSHLGLKYESKKISDLILAESTENVDIIIGGHTHTFLDKPMVVNNLKGLPVVVNQVGWAGINLGRLDITIAKGKKKNKNNSTPAILSKKTIVK